MHSQLDEIIEKTLVEVIDYETTDKLKRECNREMKAKSNQLLARTITLQISLV